MTTAILTRKGAFGLRIGVLVNPVAGLGGSVGLKGTDGPDTVAEARRRGAVDRAGPRAREALALLAARVPGARLLTVEGALGADWAEGLGLTIETRALPDLTGTARDTRDAIAAIGPVDLMVFAGGDGTARDVAGAVAEGTPLLGIPAGVKMHSGVFAVTPRAAGALMATAVSDPARLRWQSVEVMDIDETALRAGILSPRLYGLATTPALAGLMQAAKGSAPGSEDGALDGAAGDTLAGMDPGTLYVIGPGRSAGRVAERAGETPTLLGVDLMERGRLVARDVTAPDLDALTKGRKVRLVLGVTGRQGFLLGRGNQQIGADLIARVGRAGLLVIATPGKLAALDRPRLLVDTGRAELDAALAGYIRVATGTGRSTMMRVASE